MGNREVYQKITDRVIAALEKGTVPWRKPWTAAGGGRPRSMSTRQPYRGINMLLLGTEAMERGYGSPWWGTYHQIAQLSGMQLGVRAEEPLGVVIKGDISSSAARRG